MTRPASFQIGRQPAQSYGRPLGRDGQIDGRAEPIKGNAVYLQRWSREWSGDELLGFDDPNDECPDRTGASCPNLTIALARQALAERQIVELNHRFVNMLQTLASRIERQWRKRGDPAGCDDLERLVASIHASGRLHRYLLPPRKHLAVDLGSLLLNVAGAIEDAVGLRCQVETELVSVSSELAMHLATAVYELAWNAHKHAYGNVEGGVLRIACRRDAERRVLLSVADEGFGLPTSFDPRAGKGLGLMLVCATVRQFGGDLRIASHQGVCFTLRLDVP